MVLVMKLASGHVAMLKMNAGNHRSQVAALKQLQRRSYSNERALITGERLSANLELLRAQKSDNPHVALLFVWLAAKRAHLEDYFRFYLDNGFDVLWVQTQAKQLLAPAAKNGTQSLAREVLDYLLAEKNRCYQNMMLHAFSMGGYSWGECLSEMHKDPEKYEHVRKIMKAQVFDSCVDVEGIASGLPGALTRNKALRMAGTVGMYTWLTLAYPFATRHYQNSSKFFRLKPVNVPGLYFNSMVDQVSCPKSDRKVVDHWNELGVDVKLITFDDSKHVQHLGKHPDRYTDELVNLMNKTMPARGGWTADQVKADIIARREAQKLTKRQQTSTQ
ncbi:uncharacterized protein LOC100898037 [Galendromus occidentalis]|uniref:Uncharacterized protein LOC100898037 n=1 Tax=Galendromus occidentalis TaxID=34638 RepID=A0AAJ6QTX7_9ACAR|nr:uncharacterized protein LOC100898037 [Galendromus occidentalis]